MPLNFAGRIAEFTPPVNFWIKSAVCLVFGGAAQIGAAQTRIFNRSYAADYRSYDRVMRQAKTPLKFESGKTVKNCEEYLVEKQSSVVSDQFAPQLYQSEYIVCDALAIFKQAGVVKAKPFGRRRSVNYGREIYNRLDFSNLPASIAADGETKAPIFLSQRLIGRNPKVTKYKIQSDTPQWFFAVEVIAVADYNGNGKPDWILEVIDQAREGNYRGYAIWLILDAEKTGVLKAEAR